MCPRTEVCLRPKCWISLLDVVHVSLAIVANNLYRSDYGRETVSLSFKMRYKNYTTRIFPKNSSVTTYLEQSVFEDLEMKTRRKTQSKLTRKT